MNEINKKSEMEKIEEFVAIFRDVVCVSHEKGLLSSEYLENINDESQEVSLFLERFFAEKSQHFDKLYFKKLADDLTIEALSGICPCVDYAKTVKYFSTSHWEADIISILGGHTSPTEEIKVEAYQAEKDMSIFQAFSKLSPDYNRAALNKSQIRWFCLKYRYFLQDEKNFLVFLLKNFHSPKNGDSKLIGSIVQADSHGLHISIVPESKIISVKDGINNYAHIFIVPNSA